MRALVAFLPLVLLPTAARAALCTANAAPQVTCRAQTQLRVRYRITRDGYGVPHVKAQTPYDVGYATGIAQAEDRLFQMELVRKSATGNVAELFGRDFLADDIDTRRQFYSEEERQYLFGTLSCDAQRMVTGFVDGVNATIDRLWTDAGHGDIPNEFYFLPIAIEAQGGAIPTHGVRYSIVTFGDDTVYKPDPWRVTDVAAISTLLAGRFGSGGGRQLRQAALLDYLTTWFGQHAPPPGTTAAAAARDVFEDVRWLDDPKAPTTIPTTGAINRVIHGMTPVPIADATPILPSPPLLLADRLRLLVAPRAAWADAGPRSSQFDFVRGLAPSTIRAGLEAVEALERHAERLHERFGVFRKSGSNAFVVSAKRGVHGEPLLWGGPQEGFDNPNIDWEAYVKSTHYNVGGMLIAGVPGILIGHTRTHAFTTTSGEIDNSTLYVETLKAPADPNPQTADARYDVLFQGAYVPMDRRTEVFRFAGQSDSATPVFHDGIPDAGDPPLLYNVYRVHDCDPDHFHGYVVAFDLAANPPRAFSYKTAYWKNESSTVQGFIDQGFARGFDQYRAAVDRVVSLHNFFYADKWDNIAYFSAGARPAFPPGFDDRLPADGTGAQEWGRHPDGSRYVPFSRSLLSVNPTQGWLTNWNTKPADTSYIQEGNSHDEHWGEIYRSDRIAFLLAHNDHVNLKDLEEIERDVGTMDGSTDTVRAAAPFLIPVIQEAYARLVAAHSPLVDSASAPVLDDAVAVLGEWNAYLGDLSRIYPGGGHYAADYSPSRGQSGMTLFFQWWYALKQNLWGGGMHPGEPFVGTVDFADTGIDGSSYLDETTYNMFLHLVEANPGVPQRFTGDYFGGHRDEIVVESLNDAIAILSGTGPQPRRSYGLCRGGRVDTPGFGDPNPRHWPWQPEQDLDFDCLDSFADPQLATGAMKTQFGRAPSENRSTYMQAIEVGRNIVGENVIPAGESGYVHHVAGTPFKGTPSPHVGDQAELFRSFTYKPMDDLR